MRIAPLADVKARLSAYLDECGTEGPVVITRNGKPAAVLLVPYDDDDLERLMLARSPRFQALLNRSGKASKRGKAYRNRPSGRPFANGHKNERPQQRKAAELGAEASKLRSRCLLLKRVHAVGHAFVEVGQAEA